MPWREFELPEPPAGYPKKLRMLADEDIDAALVEALRVHGVDIVTVSELGYRGRDDEDIFQLAYKKKRVLLTFNGSDFMDHTRFPFHSCAGILWLAMPRDYAHLAEAAFNIAQIKRSGGQWHSKVRLKPGWEFDRWTLGPSGRVEKSTFRFVGDRTDEWYHE
jgi:hypothetical protein